MIYLKLLFSFIKIGLFSFGGGYAMIPLIQSEIEMHGWINSSEFVDIIAIAEMTPGPVAINTATFVGYKTAGFWGGVAATTGVVLPSLLLVLAVSGYFFKLQNQPIYIMIFYGVRPAITSLIAAAAFFVAKVAIVKKEIFSFTALWNSPAAFLNYAGIAIFLISFAVLLKFKLHPLWIIAGAGIAGMIIYA